MGVFYAVQLCMVMSDNDREVGTGSSGHGGTAGSSSPPVPSKWWYVGHAFFWIITGLVVYVLYKDTNKEAARRHLIVSIFLGVVVAVVFVAIMVAVELLVCGADPGACEYVDEW